MATSPPPELRQPLYPAEAEAAPLTVCVTGATSFLAAAIITRLLAAGHTVRGTVRDPSATSKVQHLLDLPGSAERLSFFKVRGVRRGQRTGCRRTADDG